MSGFRNSLKVINAILHFSSIVNGKSEKIQIIRVRNPPSEGREAKHLLNIITKRAIDKIALYF